MGAEATERDAHAPRTEASESWTEAVVEGVSVGLVTTDLEGRVVSLNRTAEQITGFGREEAAGRKPKELFQFEVCPLEATLAAASSLPPSEVNLRTKDGRLLSVRLSTELVRDSDGGLLGAVGFLRNSGRPSEDKLTSTLAATERAALLVALDGAATSQEAACRLGIGRATLWRKMKRYGLSFPKR